MMFLFLCLSWMADPSAYDLIDQAGQLKEKHPEMKTLGIVLDTRDYSSVKEAITLLQTDLEVKGFVVRLQRNIVGNSSLYARQSVLQLLENQQVDCVLVFKGSRESLNDLMVLKSIGKIVTDKHVPVYTSHKKAKVLGFSGQLIHKKDHWDLVSFFN